jgi:hypothetical protein
MMLDTANDEIKIQIGMFNNIFEEIFVYKLIFKDKCEITDITFEYMNYATRFEDYCSFDGNYFLIFKYSPEDNMYVTISGDMGSRKKLTMN